MKNSNIRISTDGVLVLTSKNGLKEYFSDKEFNYDYPEGLLPLVNDGTAFPITTESGEDVEVLLTTDRDTEKTAYQNVGSYKICIQTNDTLQILAHGDFTQICDSHKGDIDAYDFYNEPFVVNDIKPGWYLVDVFASVLEDFEADDDDEDENECELKIILEFSPQLEEPVLGTFEDVLVV